MCEIKSFPFLEETEHGSAAPETAQLREYRNQTLV